MEKPKKQG